MLPWQPGEPTQAWLEASSCWLRASDEHPGSRSLSRGSTYVMNWIVSPIKMRDILAPGTSERGLI